MKKANIILLVLIACFFASCGDSSTRYIKKAIHIMDKNGIYAQGPEWEQAKSVALTASPSTLKEAQEIVVQAGKVAGGKHTFLMTTDEVTENDTSAWEMPTVELLEENIAVIKLPPFSGNEEEGVKYANTVLGALPDALKGTILDLRGNRGGNMYPMIAAVHRFLPDDIILQLRTRRYNMEINVDYVTRVAKVERQAPIDCPVTLLTDEWTGSSGEAVMLCFRGLENTRTFGSPTAGYASCNQPYRLPDGSQLVLTTGTDVARTGEEFCDDPIQPDMLTETPLEDALEWLNKMRSGFVTINDSIQVYYKIWNPSTEQNAKTLCFVHGFGCDMNTWEKQFEAFRNEEIQLVFIDLPGYGLSDKPKVDYTFDFFAHAIDEVLNANQIKDAVFVGHSLGTPVCRHTLMTTSHSGALVDVDGVYCFYDGTETPEYVEAINQFGHAFDGPDCREVITGFVSSLAGKDTPQWVTDYAMSVMPKTPQYVASSTMQHLVECEWWTNTQLNIPVMVICTQNSGLEPDNEQKMQALYPHLNYTELTTCGHFIHMEQSEMFNAKLKTFLGTISLSSEQAQHCNQ